MALRQAAKLACSAEREREYLPGLLFDCASFKAAMLDHAADNLVVVVVVVVEPASTMLGVQLFPSLA